ncbi:MAG: FAD-dependent thymidylate synthase [Acidobacteriia bacterium]|nr:FAD-dependent thymidylate synthase [Terriglobia bacterium]MBZ5705710.1 FAD-dependent thymidylate synthase [Terriglobia bacterium]
MSLRVFKLSSPQFYAQAFLDFLRLEQKVWNRTPGATGPEELVEAAGRICYMSFGEKQSPRSNEEYIQNLIAQGHESVLEHVSWTFLLIGVSRAFTHQLVRHRIGFSFSQLSQQYHEETEAEFVEPAHLRTSPRALEAWREAVETSKQAYTIILETLDGSQNGSGLDLQKKELKRAVRSAARSVLPNATETKIIITANARALRHFFKVRGSIPGDVEMREAAAAMFKVVRDDAPALFSDFSLKDLGDKTPMLVSKLTGGCAEG